MIYSEDAPSLEKLHDVFDKRVNLVNRRKEFFYVTLDEIKEAVKNTLIQKLNLLRQQSQKTLMSHWLFVIMKIKVTTATHQLYLSEKPQSLQMQFN